MRSDLLQSPSIDLAMVVDMVESLHGVFQEYRTDRFCDQLWCDMVETARQCTVAFENTAKKRLRKLSSKLGGSYVTSASACTRAVMTKIHLDRNCFSPSLTPKLVKWNEGTQNLTAQ